MIREDMPLSGLDPAAQALSGNDLILLTQNTPDGLQSVNATLARLLQYLFVDSGAVDDYIDRDFLKQVYTLNPNSGLIGNGRSSNPMAVNFAYLNTLYVNETDFTNYQNNVNTRFDNVNTQINNINNSISQGVVPNTRKVNTGAGLVGGGNLSADRTISMGAPSSITSGSSNSASGDTHSHELAPGAVINAKLADGAVGTSKIADGAVTDPKIVSMSANKLTGVVPSANLPAPPAGTTIVDNLTSLAINEALSANQGRVLAGQIKALSDSLSFKITDFDFMVIKYTWTAFAGRDLDTRTMMNYATGDAYLFQNYELKDSNGNVQRMGFGQSRSTLENNGVVIARWAGDNTGSGSESVLIYFNRLTQAMPNINLFDFIFKAHWYVPEQRRDGFIILQIETFKGGDDMDQNGYEYVPREGTKKFSSQAFYASTPLVGHSGGASNPGFELGRLQLDLGRNLLLFRLSEQNLIKTSLAQNGYTTLASGLIMQWGRGWIANGNNDVAFPIAFPNSLVNVQVTDEGAGSISHGYNWSLSDNTKFRCTSQNGGALSYSYVAIGY